MTDYNQILVFVVFFVATFMVLVRVDLYLAIVYCFLFIYTIFTMYGYSQRPQFSESIGAYFGPEIFPEYFSFVVSCFVLFFALCVIFGPWLRRRRYYRVVEQPLSGGRTMFLLGTLVHWGFLTALLIVYSAEFNYANITSEEFVSSSWFNRLWGVAIKFMLPNMLLWWFLLREKYLGNKYWLLFLAGLTLFLIVCQRVGNRTDVLACFLGIACYEIELARQHRAILRKLFSLVPATLVLVWGASWIEHSRANRDFDPRTPEEKLVVSDYYAPSHMLLAAISYKYVAPKEVLKSNLNNTLVLRGYPYLQASITDLFKPGLATRTTGYAFYVFTEGYLVCGWCGFIYSAFVVFAGVAFWRISSLSNRDDYNRFVLMLICSMAANVVRSQTVYFVKYFYTYIIPALVLLYLANGLRPALGSRRQHLDTHRTH